ncbi:MAG: hypothetical protein U0X20_11685 [Caldilineaceae bacterium]
MNTDDLSSSAATAAAATPPPRTMIWWTSGIDSVTDAGLAAGGVKRVLGDRVSVPFMSMFFDDSEIALDCGSYRHFKAQKKRKHPAPLTEQDARQYAALFPERKFAFRIAMDVIGDAATTLQYWNNIFMYQPHTFVPVYQWGAPRADLEQYLDQAVYIHAVGTRLVCIGGLAPILRGGHREKDKQKKAEKELKRERTLEQLIHICERHPGRFHILGLNHLDAINKVRHLVASADASKWLDGRRYGYVFFIDSRNGRLRYAPSNQLSDSSLKPLSELNTNQRLTHNARMIAQYAENERQH